MSPGDEVTALARRATHEDLARAFVGAFDSVADAIMFLQQHAGDLDVEMFPSERGDSGDDQPAALSTFSAAQRRWVGRVLTAPRPEPPRHPLAAAQQRWLYSRKTR